MGVKVLVTARSFSQNDKTPKEMLLNKGYEIISNPFGRIMTENEIAELIEDVDGVILGVDPFGKDIFQRAQKLKVISRYGVGIDNIDKDSADSRNIPIYRTVGANTQAVADYAFGLMLDLTRKIAFIDRECRKGNWKKIKTREMNGKVLGLIGFGAIGKAVAKRGTGFNMRVLVYDPFVNQEMAREYGVELVELDQLYAESDFISLHVPLIDATYHMINADVFKAMKPTAVLVNTARGGIVDEEAMYQALKSGEIAAAGVDVFDVEPPSNPALMELDNLLVGAHCAASSVEAIDKMSYMAAENLIKGLEERN